LIFLDGSLSAAAAEIGARTPDSARGLKFKRRVTRLVRYREAV